MGIAVGVPGPGHSNKCVAKSHGFICLLLIFFKDFIYLFMRDTQREAETQAEGEAGSMQEA